LNNNVEHHWVQLHIHDGVTQDKQYEFQCNTFFSTHGAQQNDCERVQMRGDGGAIRIGMRLLRLLQCNHLHMIRICTRGRGRVWSIGDRGCSCVWIGGARSRRGRGKGGETPNDIVALLLGLLSHNSHDKSLSIYNEFAQCS
jgi:hypothetical protein